MTDKPALILHNVNREALLTRLAHCSAYQLLVAGVFNGINKNTLCLFAVDNIKFIH